MRWSNYQLWQEKKQGEKLVACIHEGPLQTISKSQLNTTPSILAQLDCRTSWSSSTASSPYFWLTNKAMNSSHASLALSHALSLPKNKTWTILIAIIPEELYTENKDIEFHGVI